MFNANPDSCINLLMSMSAVCISESQPSWDHFLNKRDQCTIHLPSQHILPGTYSNNALGSLLWQHEISDALYFEERQTQQQCDGRSVNSRAARTTRSSEKITVFEQRSVAPWNRAVAATLEKILLERVALNWKWYYIYSCNKNKI